MPNQLIPIKSLVIAALEAALNSYLGMDENLEQLLLPMAGKVIAIQIQPYAATLYLCPTLSNIQILESYYGKVDATLSGSLAALGLMGLSATPMRALFTGKVSISGDTQVASKLQRLFGKLDINVEHQLAQYTGEKFAIHFSQMLRSGWQWSQQTLTALQLNLEEFLQEESRDLTAKAEAELLFQHIDTCRNDYDRLQARINRLNQRLTTSSQQENQPGPQP